MPIFCPFCIYAYTFFLSFLLWFSPKIFSFFLFFHFFLSFLFHTFPQMTSGDIFLLHQRRGGEGWGVISNKLTPPCWYAGPLMTACSTTRAPLGTSRASTFPTGRSCPARTTGFASDESSVCIHFLNRRWKCARLLNFIDPVWRWLMDLVYIFLIKVLFFSFAVWKIWEFLHMRTKKKNNQRNPYCLVPIPGSNVLFIKNYRSSAMSSRILLSPHFSPTGFCGACILFFSFCLSISFFILSGVSF